MTVPDAGQVAEKTGTLLRCWWLCEPVQPSRTAMEQRPSRAKKMFMPFNPEILLLGIHPREIIYNKDEAISPSIIYNSTEP